MRLRRLRSPKTLILRKASNSSVKKSWCLIFRDNNDDYDDDDDDDDEDDDEDDDVDDDATIIMMSMSLIDFTGLKRLHQVDKLKLLIEIISNVIVDCFIVFLAKSFVNYSNQCSSICNERSSVIMVDLKGRENQDNRQMNCTTSSIAQTFKWE
uniref:Uncharacterized protein n=1 Tax=Vespula pensylvanica TaxID=30213 RepID=A0A834KPY0_VESPE|nr:hypothetical protein H0235_013433 [Vespula pensylvanica]